MNRFSPAADAAIALALGGWLLVLVPCAARGADDALGRLFFTPERRQQLDRQREMNILDKQQIQADPTLTIDGVVTRSSGKRTAWVNGRPQNEDQTANGLTVTPRLGEPGKVLVDSSDSPQAKARVGETVNRHTGEASDLLNGGRISTRSAVAR
ncbi:conserved exported hypothetical protein [Candidatus Accumulibacter aalborgensis]|uniref:Uncharacterized protein n=1 Tax=Candidatus Accumulibacter aalborgensis TaxID=1860102 RepID=A0A1A8XU12_9PROT|nr:hypothetical protein [Candidatus Accumulibacter aalborgensis]SBT08221.1 conserved exported hypothetical protein [Candidatus Accumulibacter aalborgensis]